MDINFADLKKEAAATADSIFKPQTIDQQQQEQVHNTSAGASSDNAHTENYFANEQKEADFEHVDPQAFMQRMSAGAKEAQEELDAKFTQQQQHLSNFGDDFLTEATRDMNNFGQHLKQNVGAVTNDFMNIERGVLGDLSAKEPVATPLNELKEAVKSVPEKHLLDYSFAAGADISAPLQPFKNDDLFSKDSDTDTPPSVSYNPSPIKKNPVADALKEQDNDQFISSEDLLGDFKDDLKKSAANVASKTVSSAATLLQQHIPTTDLDAEEFDDGEFNDAKAAMAVPATPPATPILVSPTPLVKETPTAIVAPKVAPPPPPAAKIQPVTKTAATPDDLEQPKLLGVEEIFYKYGLDAWFKPERLHPKVESLIYWRDVKKSGIVFGAGLLALLAISCFSVISVFAYLSLFTLIATVSYRSYKSVMQAVQKTSDGHPFKDYLDADLTLSQEKVQNIAGVVVAHVNGFVSELRRLFLVEDLIDSIKFGGLLWVLTYIGALFNGMTLVILAFVSLFTLPKVYENNKQSIDTYLQLVRSKLVEITDKIKGAIPIGNKKPVAVETDKDK